MLCYCMINLRYDLWDGNQDFNCLEWHPPYAAATSEIVDRSREEESEEGMNVADEEVLDVAVTGETDEPTEW